MGSRKTLIWTAVGSVAGVVSMVVAVVAYVRPPVSSGSTAEYPSASGSPSETVVPPTTPAAPTTGANPTQAGPTSSYTITFDRRELRLPFPDSCETFVDLDVPNVHAGGNITDDEFDYDRCHKESSDEPLRLVLTLRIGRYGTGVPNQPPTAERCLDAVQFNNYPQRSIAPKDLPIGFAWCVDTPTNNVVWLKLIRKDGPAATPDLIFLYTLWDG